MLIVVLVSFGYTAANAQMINQSDFTPNPSILAGNMTGASNQSDFTDLPLPVAPGDLTASDFSDCTNDFPSTSCRIAKDLTGLKPEEIKVYGLSDYPSSVIQNALMFLNPGNLTKVLLNLPPNELIQIREGIAPQVFNNTLSLVPEPQRTELLNKTSAG